jgi:hypothetical protein
MKQFLLLPVLLFCSLLPQAFSQQLSMPAGAGNLKCMAGRRVGMTDIEIRWNAPGVKGREGKIWGTPVAHYGMEVLGYGSNDPSPWRAGADENTTIYFSTDVKVQGKSLPAGKYGFHIILAPDSCTLIFSKNSDAWGSYFYNPTLDALRVSTRQLKGQPLQERLEYKFLNHSASSIDIALDWENWRIPFTIETDLNALTVASLRRELSSGLGFDPPSLQTAANWCLSNNTNFEEALTWIERATDPTLGGVKSFTALSTKAGLLQKLGKTAEADKIMQTALENATVLEMHGYGRRLIAEKQYAKALDVFRKNFDKNGDTWPVHVGLARGYSANGDLKKALEHAKIALSQATDDVNKRSLEAMVKTLSEGKAILQ